MLFPAARGESGGRHAACLTLCDNCVVTQAQGVQGFVGVLDHTPGEISRMGGRRRRLSMERIERLHGLLAHDGP